MGWFSKKGIFFGTIGIFVLFVFFSFYSFYVQVDESKSGVQGRVVENSENLESGDLRIESGGKFEVILITEADHYDYKEEFVSDIYLEVSEPDGIWSGPISEGEFIRVKFEENLGRLNDITIYSRVLAGNPRIEVYEASGNEVVAVFEELDEGYNRIFLEGLIGESDGFDLRVLGGSIEIDYIVDPTLANPPSSCAGGWSACVNAFVDDTSTATVTGATTGITGDWEGFSFNIPAGSTIDSVVVTTRRHGSHAGNTFTMRVWDETGSGFLADTDLGGSTVTCNTVVTDVTSQKAWTVNDINNFLVQYENTGGGGQPAGRQWHICYIEVTVTFTAPNPPAYSNLATNPTSPTTYVFGQGYQFNSTWTADAGLSIDTVLIEFEGVNRSASSLGGGVYSFNPGDLAAGSYDYYWWANDTNGVSNQTSTLSYTVNQAVPSGSITGSSPITYGASAGISGGESNQGDGDVVYRLYRNGTEVSNPDNSVLAAGSYSYVFNTTGGQNYTANASLDTFDLTVDKAAGNVTTFVNNTRNNITIERGSSIYLNATRVSGDSSGILRLYLGGILINQGTSGTIFNLTQFNSVGEFNVTGFYLESQNYTSDFETWFVTVEDTVSPDFVLHSPLNTTYTFTSIDLNVSSGADDIDSWWYNLNGGGNISFSPNTTISAAQGSNNLIVYVNDSLGNENFESLVFFVDSVFPLISFVAPTESDGANVSQDWIFANVSVIEDNFANITFRLYNSSGLANSTTYTSQIFSINWTGLADGIYSYNVSIVDILGQTNSTSTRQIRLDTTAPSINIIEPQPIIYNFDIGIPLNVSVLDSGVGVSECWYNLDGGANVSVLCNVNTTFNASEGGRTLNYYSNDTLGNLNSDSVAFTVTLGVPSVVLDLPADDSWLNDKSVEFVYTPEHEDGIDSCILYGNWNGGWHANQTNSSVVNVSQNSFFVDLSSETDGDYLWNVWCNSTAGTSSFAANNFTFNFDTVNPLIDYGQGTLANASYSAEDWIFVNVSIVEDNFANVSFRLYNSSGLVISNTFTGGQRSVNWTGLSDGTYEYNVTTYDLAGNFNSTQTRTVNLDNAGPDVEFVSPSEVSGVYRARDYVEINASATDSSAGVDSITIEIFNSSGSLINSSTGFSLIHYVNFSGLSDGIYFYNSTANDSVGNLGFSETRNITLDRTLPIVEFISPTLENASHSTEDWIFVNVSIIEDNFANVTFALYNSSGFVISNTFTGGQRTINWTSLIDGDYEYNVSVYDLAGNLNFSETRQVTLDNVNPLVDFMSPTPQNGLITNETSFVINLSVVDLHVDDALLEWNGVNESFDNQNGEFFWSTKSGLTEGSYSFRGYGLDLAGNVNSTESRTVNIDLTAPSWSGLNQTVGGVEVTRVYRGEIALLSANWSDNFELGSAVLATNETGILENKAGVYSSPQNLSGTANLSVFNWSNSSVIPGENVSYRISGRDFAGNVNTTSLREFQMWGRSEVFASVFPSGISIGGNTTATCFVSDNVTGEGLANYNVSFYLDESFLGSNLTDSNGNSVFTFNVSQAGSYQAGCEIGDFDSIFYSASAQNSSSASLGVGFGLSTYDYSNVTFHRAYEGIIDFPTTPIADSYLTLENMDTIYQTFEAGQGSFAYTRFEFKVDEDLSEIMRMNYSWTGFGSVGSGTQGYNLYVRNFTSGTWTQVASYSTDANPQNESFEFLGGFSDLINGSGYTMFLARSFSAAPGSGQQASRWARINTDYIKVDVYSDILPPTVALSSPVNFFNSSSSNVDFSCYVVDDSSVLNASLYGNWSGGWGAKSTNTSGINDVNYNFSAGSLTEGVYSWNCEACDNAGNCAFRQTNRTLTIDLTAPVVSLLNPNNGMNFSSANVGPFNYSVTDNFDVSSCSLYGNFSGVWEENLSSSSITEGSVLSFGNSSALINDFYSWNVECTDFAGNSAFNSTNRSFAAFDLPYNGPALLNATQTSNDGTGNVTFFWDSVSNALSYKVYYFDPLSSGPVLLDETSGLNYTDSSFSGERRRFYRVSAWNPTGENSSVEIFGAHVYSLRHNINTRNWLGFPTNASYLASANDSLNEITGATAFTMWNETMQRRLTCNEFSCPTFPGCTESNCDFNIEPGRGYEVNLNGSFPAEVNWSLVGKVSDPVNLTLVKNSTSFGKNWISIYANTSLLNARNVLDSTGAEVVSRWDSSTQRSQGYLKFGPIFLGTNFPLGLEGSYEVAVSQTMNWTQV